MLGWNIEGYRAQAAAQGGVGAARAVGDTDYTALCAGVDAAIVPLLSDVESWQGRIDEKIDAWLLFCEAQISLAKFGDAEHCLRRLDGAGIVPQELALCRLVSQPSSAPPVQSAKPAEQLAMPHTPLPVQFGTPLAAVHATLVPQSPVAEQVWNEVLTHCLLLGLQASAGRGAA